MTLTTWIDQAFLKNDSATLAQLKRRLKSQIAELDREQQVKGGALATLEHLIEQAATQRRDALAELAAAAAQRLTTAAEVANLAQRRDALTAELAALAEQQAAAEQALASLNQQRLDTEQALERQQQALEQATAATQTAADTAAATALEPPQVAYVAIEADLAALTQRRDRLAAEINTEIDKANSEIQQARREFEYHTQQTELALDRGKLEAERQAADLTAQAAERWRDYWQAPLQADLTEAQAEIGRLSKLLEAKQGKTWEWQPEQITALLVKTLDDGTRRPQHCRISGESESGKSHLVNQLLTSGLKALGLDIDVELYDPYPSDTHWKIKPTIADDPVGTVAALASWREICESDQPATRERPLLIVLDEADELIRQFGELVTCSIKALLKRGRHCNLIIWLLGQNANVVKGMDWSDLRGAAGIYLNQCGYEYVKNGMKGRNCTALQGELDAIASKHSYYAIVHPKSAPRPYAVAVPKLLFTEQPASQPAQPAPTPAAVPTGVVCPHCSSSRTKFNGRRAGGERRRSCNDCGKSWTVN